MAFPLTDAEHAAIKARIDEQEELIVAAAIRVRPGLIVMAERPGRHGNCITPASLISCDRMSGGEHGFVTNRGRFVGRIEAAKIVAASGQGSKREGVNGLFSEDMWNDRDDEMSRRAPRPEEIF